MIVAVHEVAYAQSRLGEPYVRDTLQSLEPVPHRCDDSTYPWVHEWAPLPGVAKVQAPPGCSWARSNGRLFLYHPEAKHLDGYAVLTCARSRIFGFRLADPGAEPTPIRGVVERFVPRHFARPFEGLVGGPDEPEPTQQRTAPPPAPEPPPIEFAPTPEPAREPVPAGFLF